MTRHILGLFAGCPGARAWRRRLSVEGTRPEAGVDVLREAGALVREPTAAAVGD
jgi:tRNA-dihydrouridine synthase A